VRGAGGCQLGSDMGVNSGEKLLKVKVQVLANVLRILQLRILGQRWEDRWRGGGGWVSGDGVLGSLTGEEVVGGRRQVVFPLGRYVPEDVVVDGRRGGVVPCRCRRKVISAACC